MVESISYLYIKPVYRFRSNSSELGQTTMSGFDELLIQEMKAASDAEASQASGAAAAAQDAPQSTSSPDESGSSESSDSAAVLYTDPNTGNTVQYIDVSEEANQTSGTSSSSSAKTTSASTMKTTKYDSYFKEAAEKYGLSESLLKAIAKAESNFNPNDVSSAGAIGIMQLMPATAKELGVTNAYDPRQNILGGAQCIKNKLDEFHGDLRLALAAYNAGSGAVKRNGGVPSYCTKYVNKVISYKEAYETAEAVG